MLPDPRAARAERVREQGRQHRLEREEVGENGVAREDEVGAEGGESEES